MAEEHFKCIIAAIPSADMEGFSRLMDDSYEATVRTLTSYCCFEQVGWHLSKRRYVSISINRNRSNYRRLSYKG